MIWMYENNLRQHHHYYQFILALRTSLNIQEYNDAGDVIDRRVLFLPFLHRLSNQRFSCFLSAVVLVMRHNNIDSFIIGNEFPDAVTCQNHKLIRFDQVHFSYFWQSVDSDFNGGCIAEASWHSKTRNIFMKMPNACWTKWVALHISVSCNSSTSVQNALLFIWLISFVISIQRNAN